jgi:putative ABC transport system permease protein
MGGQLVAIAFVVAAAIGTYVTMRGAYEALRTTRDAYYARYRFAHVFARLKRAPLHVVEQITAIPGVSAVDARITATVPLDVPGLQEPASAHILSLGGSLNGVHLQSGRIPEEDELHSVVVSEQFAGANGLQIGDSLSAVLYGKWETLRITGIGGSPEYLVEIAGSGIVPDKRRFGILWMPRRGLEAAFSMRGAFNDVTILLAPGGDEKRVISRLDTLLAPYGGTGAYGREDHHPHEVLSSEIMQGRVTAAVIPAIFLFVAAFLINMVLSRVVTSQRDQIAVLRAFGYGRYAIALHYMGFAVIVVLAGAAIGIPLGVWMGRGVAGMYLEFFNFPELRFTISPASVAISAGVSAASAVAGALSSSIRAASIPPAEGMRGEPPPAFHATPLEPLHRLLSSAERMIMRSIERRPLRAVLAATGIALAVMILIIGRFTYDAIEALMTIHFRTAERHDVMLVFTEPLRDAVRYDLARLPGVRRVETFRVVPVRIRAGHLWRRVPLMAIDDDGELRRLVQRDRSIVPIPPRGVVLTQMLADELEVGRGSRVRMELLEGRRLTIEANVVATANEMLGVAAYGRKDEVARLAQESDLASGAYLSVDRGARPALDRRLKQLPIIANAAYREATLESFRETMAKNLTIWTRVIVLFACIIAFGVVFNAARIALSERGRDLATLRVLGFSRPEVGILLLGEQAVLTAAGIPLGLLLGRLVAGWLVHLFDTEEYRLVETVSVTTYAFAFLVVMVATLLSFAAVWRRIARLDLVEVLKTRE